VWQDSDFMKRHASLLSLASQYWLPFSLNNVARPDRTFHSPLRR